LFDRLKRVQGEKSLTVVSPTKLKKVIPEALRKNLRVKRSDAHGQLVGLFFVSQIVPEWEPYSNPFRQWENPALFSLLGDHEPDSSHVSIDQIAIGDNVLHALNAMNCSVVDLYDSSFSLDDMHYLNELRSLEVLGLPCREMKFDRQFEFPANLKYLIVRNADLSASFFQRTNAIEKIGSSCHFELQHFVTRPRYI